MARNKTAKPAKRPAKGDGYHHGDLRTTLLEATLKMLRTKSPEDLSLRELARVAGVSQAAPYRHFKHKEDLLAAICQQGFELKFRYMQEALNQAKGDPLESFYSCGLAYFRMGRLHPQHFKLMFGSSVEKNKYPNLEQAACSTFVLLRKMVEDSQQSGLIGPGDPYHKAMHCWFMVHGFTSLYAAGRLSWLGVEEQNCEAAFRTYMSQYLQGAKTNLDSTQYGFLPFATEESKAYLAAMNSLQSHE